MPATFIDAAPADLEPLVEMMRLLREDDPAGVAFDEPAARAALPAVLAGRAPASIWIIVDDAGNRVGYVAMTTFYSLELGGAVAVIDELFVARPHRRKGFAGAAIRHIEAVARARRARALLLEVAESNVGARSLYARAGFVDRHYRAMTKTLE
jgi:ribosomal protein S18 acetylase RimI-like enzyme